MRDNADLQDRTQQLEHIVLQLQSETDTIGINEIEIYCLLVNVISVLLFFE